MKKISLDHFTKFNFISAFKANREGKQAVFALSNANLGENKYESDLYLLKNDKTKRLTSDRKCRSFVWENEQTILFAAKRQKSEEEEKGYTHYYRLSLDGGEAMPAFKLPVVVGGIWPLDKGRFLVLASIDHEQPDLYKAKAKEREEYFKEKKDFDFRHKMTRIPFYFNGAGFLAQGSSRLFLYDEKKDKLLPLSDADLDIESVFCQDGHDAIYVTAAEYTNRAESFTQIYRLSKSELSEKKMSEESFAKELQLVYKPMDYSISCIFQGSEKVFVFASDQKTYGINESHKIYTLEGNKLKMHLDEEQKLWNSMGSDAVLYGCPGVQVIDGDLYYFGASGSDSALYRLDKEGKSSEVYRSEARLDGFAILKGKYYFVALTWDKLQEIYKLNGEEFKQVTKFNDKVLKGCYVARPEPIELSKEIPIQGWVLLPENFDKKKKYPAILDIHGGPRTIYGSCFFHEMQYWASEGYVVFFCNPRGSDGRGDAFADIRGKYGEIDYEDIMDFTDAVLKEYPQIDQERIGVTGGSYGGFMTNWIIGHTDRFKAAATQRSISNWLSFYGTSDISYTFACDQNACDTLSEEGFMKLWKHSPIRYVNNVKTPTLIIHSDADYRCPEEQAFQLFTALLDRGIPSEMYLFKDETHELSRSGRPKGRIERLRRITEWMDKYLKA
ncbi:MAG: S9 family peptidase [Eubacteriales bacterium]|nr:S9 family peptidase [Eubacteriales bacterium]